MQVFKILTPEQHAAFAAAGRTDGAPVDMADGYIHFSTAEQVAETANKHFAGQGTLMLLACDAAALGDALRWEPSRGGAPFPHLYRPLHAVDVIRTEPWAPAADGTYVLPDWVTA